MGLPPIKNILNYESDTVALSNVTYYEVTFATTFSVLPLVMISLSGSATPIVTANIGAVQFSTFDVYFSAPFTGTLFYQVIETSSDRVLS